MQNSTATFTFTGTGISWLATLEPTGGTAEVTLEGSTQTVSLKSPFTRPQQIVYTRSGLTNTTHTLTIRVTSTGTVPPLPRVTVDAFDITGALTTVACTYTDPAHVHAVSSCGSESYTYDAAGNLTARKTGNTTVQDYHWDVQNRLSSSLLNGATTTFTYDAAGTRVKKLAGATPTVYPDQHYECTTNAICSRYVFAKEQRLALIDSAGAIHYYHTDHLGSSTVVSYGSGSSVGTLEQTLTYEPYGALRSNSLAPASGVHHKFTGKELDDSTGLYDYGARYYDPVLSRFLSADTEEPDHTDPQSLNRYSYTRNNPLKYIDPSGNYALDFGSGTELAFSYYNPESDQLQNTAIKQTAHQAAVERASKDSEFHRQQLSVGELRVSNSQTRSFSVITDAGQDIGQLWLGAPSVAENIVGPTIFDTIIDIGNIVAAATPTYGIVSRLATLPRLSNTVGAVGPGAVQLTKWGWEGARAWRDAVKVVKSGGTIENIAGKIPSRTEAEHLLKEAGAKMERVDLKGHPSPNPHTFPHINYTTSSGMKGTIRIE